MQRSALKNKYMKEKTDEADRAFRKQKNYTNIGNTNSDNIDLDGMGNQGRVPN